MLSPKLQLIRGCWNWKSRGAVIGLCGGFGAPILGALVTVISWFTNQAWHGISFSTAGTTLFLLAIPLLIVGAHCLDLLDEEKHG